MNEGKYFTIYATPHATLSHGNIYFRYFSAKLFSACCSNTSHQHLLALMSGEMFVQGTLLEAKQTSMFISIDLLFIRGLTVGADGEYKNRIFLRNIESVYFLTFNTKAKLRMQSTHFNGIKIELVKIIKVGFETSLDACLSHQRRMHL